MLPTFRLVAFMLLISATLSGCLDEVNVAPDPAEAAPAVTGAIAISNTRVRVSFSQPMAAEAEQAASYVVAQQNVNGEAGTLAVTAATFANPEHTAVDLVTLSQNDVTYKVTVVGVRSESGQEFWVQATNGLGFVTANSASFAGAPPSGAGIDTDIDGLADNEEQRGWLVTTIDVNGTVMTREVTSDPFSADTDRDGLSDKLERSLGTDPRNRDTDQDGLADAHEYNGLFSSPTNQDTDGDDLGDGSEVTFFKTSPLLQDTDGDQIMDDDEVILANRNPRLADLPQPVIRIESIALELDVRFDETTEQGTTQGQTENFSSTLSQSAERTRSRTSEVNDKVSAGFAAETKFEAGVGVTLAGTKFSNKFSVSGGFEHSWSSSWSDESSNATQKEYNRSLESAQEVTENISISRVVEDARISTLVYLSTAGDVAFTLRDLQITALVDDPRNPGRYVPVATLVPATENVFNLGPIRGEIGPLVFSARDIFPGQVERLMQDPSGVIFKIANYNIEDESGRNFAFSSQEVTDRTVSLSLDFGGEPATEYYRAASSFGQPVGRIAGKLAVSEGISEAELRYQFGLLPSDVDSPLAFDLSGKNIGVVFHDIMQDVLGLNHYDAATDTTNQTTRFNSYATEIGANGVERVTRIRQSEGKPETQSGWMVLTPSGLIMSGELSFGDGDVQADDQQLFSGTGISLAYVQDKDSDRIPARLEALHRCSDTLADSDGDTLSDYFEVFGEPRLPSGARENPDNVWLIEVVGAPNYEAFSSCNSVDTDQDGISDRLEYLNTKTDGPYSSYRTDPKKVDTDGDGLTDQQEINGFLTWLNDIGGALTPADTSRAQEVCVDTTAPSPSPFPDRRAVLCKTDPLNRDSDGDGIIDGAERALFANPTTNDISDLNDLDGDTLMGFEENNGWPVTATMLINDASVTETCEVIAGAATTACNRYVAAFGLENAAPSSDPLKPDTDNDGLRDNEERDAGTHPRVNDSDLDGRTDEEELLGGGESVFTNPLHWDTDTDLLSDGGELIGWLVTTVGGTPYPVKSNPLLSDADSDLFPDGEEKAAGTDPDKFNTDDDKYNYSDLEEGVLGLSPLDGSDVCVGVKFTTSDSVADDSEVALSVLLEDPAFVNDTNNKKWIYSQNKRPGNHGPIYVKLKTARRLQVFINSPSALVGGTWRDIAVGSSQTDAWYDIDSFEPATQIKSGSHTFGPDQFRLAASTTLTVSWTVTVLSPANADADNHCIGSL